MLGKIGAPEILIILVVFLLIFGARRLPDIARSLGQSMRILKSETKAMRTSDDVTAARGASPPHAESAGQVAPPHAPTSMPGAQATSVTAYTEETVGTR